MKFSYHDLLIGAIYEAQKKGLGTKEKSLDNIDILKYIELFKDYYQELFRKKYYVSEQLIEILKGPIKLYSDLKLIPIYEKEENIDNQYLQEIFIHVNKEYDKYLDYKYFEEHKILYLDDYRGKYQFN